MTLTHLREALEKAGVKTAADQDLILHLVNDLLAHARYASSRKDSGLSCDALSHEPAFRDILRRAMAADPRATEADLLSLGARGAASDLGADHLAHVHRGEFQAQMALEVYYEAAPA